MHRQSLPFILGVAALAGAAGAAPPPTRAAFERAVAEAKAAMMADPQQALAKSRAAAGLADAMPPSRDAAIARATARWLQAEANLFSNQVDAARPLVEAGLAEVSAAAPGSKLEGDLRRSRGALFAMGGQVQQALAEFQRAHRIFARAGEARSQALALQDIGQIYWDAGDYQRVLSYYSQASELYTKDPAFSLTSHNNLAEVLQKLGRLNEAEREYGAALASARRLGSPVLQVRILSNLAAAQVDNRRFAAARRTLERAAALARNGEASGWAPFVYGVSAKLARAEGDLGRAAGLLGRTFAGVDLAKSPPPFKAFHEIAADTYERLGQEELALAHLKAFRRLDGEARDLTASTSSQLMAARFDFANQNLRISQLKQGQLRRDVEMERQRSRFRAVLLTGLLVAGGLVISLLAAGYVSIRRSRNVVRATNRELTEVNVKLGRALAAKTEFLATTSHEIRTPLNGILGMTQVILADGSVERDVRERVEVVHSAGEAMRALVDDILDVAKMETGELTIADERVDLHAILTEAGRLWRGHATAKGLTLDLAIDGAPRLIRSDPTRIRQIVFNLLSNATKFTLAGRIELVATTADGADGPELVVRVADTGIGIPPDQQQLVFEPFHQVDGGTTRQFGGTGLGLAICRNLATAMAGSIAVESVPGEGSTFTVRLPLVLAEPMVAPGVAPASRPASLAEARLLVVEANLMAQGVLRALFEPAAKSVECVEEKDQALVELAAGTADLLLIEPKGLASAGESALDALRALTAAAAAAQVPATVVFAPSDELPLGDVAQLGAQVVLKPVGGAALRQALAGQVAAAEPAMEAAPPLARTG